MCHEGEVVWCHALTTIKAVLRFCVLEDTKQPHIVLKQINGSACTIPTKNVQIVNQITIKHVWQFKRYSNCAQWSQWVLYSENLTIHHSVNSGEKKSGSLLRQEVLRGEANRSLEKSPTILQKGYRSMFLKGKQEASGYLQMLWMKRVETETSETA